MKLFNRKTLSLSISLIISACGQNGGTYLNAQFSGKANLSGSGQNGTPLAAAVNRQATTGRGTTSTFGSGNTGNQNTKPATSTGSGVTQASNPASGVDFWGRSQNSVVTSGATRPEDCAQLYNKYSRVRGNLKPALSQLATCLNSPIIKNNQTLYQQYLVLRQGADQQYINQRTQMYQNYLSQIRYAK